MKKELHIKRINRVTLVLHGIGSEFFALPRHWCEKHDTMFAVCTCVGMPTHTAFGSEQYPLIEVVD
jgi:hypothetical protein